MLCEINLALFKVMEVLGQVVARLSFLPTLAYNVAMERVTGRRWWDRVDGRVILGAIPFRSSYTRELVEQQGIRAVVALNEPYELALCSHQAAGWAALGATFLHLPTTDLFAAPSQARLRRGVAWILEQQQGSVYVHCKAGRARSATLVAAYLMEAEGCGVEEAVARVREARPHILLQGHHMEALKDYHADMVARGKEE